MAAGTTARRETRQPAKALCSCTPRRCAISATRTAKLSAPIVSRSAGRSRAAAEPSRSRRAQQGTDYQRGQGSRQRSRGGGADP